MNILKSRNRPCYTMQNNLAEMYKVSDVTIYAKLKLKQLAPYLVTKDRKRYVTEGALPVLSGLLNPVQSLKPEPATETRKDLHCNGIRQFKRIS